MCNDDSTRYQNALKAKSIEFGPIAGRGVSDLAIEGEPVPSVGGIGREPREIVDAPSHFTACSVLGTLLAIGSNPDTH